jgi:MFS-type transporter involved in bile tolerance (Atg22 family)
MTASTSATLRAGAIGGMTLALAIAAQRFAADYAMQMCGLIIVIVGFSIVGLFAARNSGALDRKAGSRVGLVSGLIAGLFVALAFVAVNLVASLEPSQLAELRQQVTDQIQMWPPQQAAMYQQMSPEEQDQLIRFATGTGLACCGIAFPLIGLLLGSMGGAMAPGMFDVSGGQNSDRK